MSDGEVLVRGRPAGAEGGGGGRRGRGRRGVGGSKAGGGGEGGGKVGGVVVSRVGGPHRDLLRGPEEAKRLLADPKNALVILGEGPGTRTVALSRPVEAIRLVATDTVDETILELQALRRGQKKGVQGTGDLRGTGWNRSLSQRAGQQGGMRPRGVGLPHG